MRFNLQFPLVLISTLLVVGCSVNVGSKVEDSGPTIAEGFYHSDDTSLPVPLVNIRKESGKTYSYGLLEYACAGRSQGFFDQTGVTFSDSPSSAAGPSISVLGQKCDIKTDIQADSGSTIKIFVTLNGVAQPPYLLHKGTKEQALQILHDRARQIVDMRASTEACVKSFGDSCQSLKIVAKN